MCQIYFGQSLADLPNPQFFCNTIGGTWHSTHIDDLRPPQPNRPEISHLRGQGVHSLLQQDLNAMNIQGGNEPIEMEMETKEARLDSLENMDVGVEGDRREMEANDGMEELTVQGNQ